MKFGLEPEPTQEELEEFAKIVADKPYDDLDEYELRKVSLKISENNQAHKDDWWEKHWMDR